MDNTTRAKIALASQDRIRSSREKVDDYMISAYLAIIAAFVVLLTVRQPTSLLIASFAALCIVSLVLGLLSALWHKYRAPLREAHLEKLIHERSYKGASDIVEFLRTFGVGDPNLPPKALEQMHKRVADQLQIMEIDVRAISRRVAASPLSERHARLKHRMDVCARYIRYPAFLIGMLTFVAAVLLLVIQDLPAAP